MAIYRFEAKIIGRSDNPLGRSVVACAAYRSGTKLHDEKYDFDPDYSRRKSGIVHTEIVAPENAPAWATDREKLWNEVEKKEDTSTRRKTAQLSREFQPALPHELTREQRHDLVMGFVKEELVARGMVADVAIHEPKEGYNHHAHILCTMRSIDAEGFGKKDRTWNDDALLKDLREAWEVHTNSALEAAGRPERVDRRSLADQGIDREPEPKLGVACAAMERKGIETRQGLLIRWTAFENRIRSAVTGIKDEGEVPQYGIGATWWERAQVAVGEFSDMMRDESSGGRNVADLRAGASAGTRGPEGRDPSTPPDSMWQQFVQQERKPPAPDMDIG